MTNWQNGEYQRLMMTADAVRDDVASRDFSRQNLSVETIGGIRLQKDIYEKAVKLRSKLHFMNAHGEERYEIANAIAAADCWNGNNDPHWIKVRSNALDRLVTFGLHTEGEMSEWLER
jgi:hypothetical protein